MFHRRNRVVKGRLGKYLLILFCSQSVFLDFCWAESDTVEITYPVDVFTPYQSRRPTHGIGFSIGWQRFNPNNMESLLDEDMYFNDTYTTPVSLIFVEVGYKWNFPLGSISLLPGYAYGSTSTDVDEVSRTLTVTKYYGKGVFALDNLMSEPLVVPFVSGGIYKMQLTEKESVASEFGGTINTGFGFEYSFGLMFQLNWLESDLARRSLVESGLQNTFVEVSLNSTAKTQDAADPNLGSSMNLGAAIRLEF